LTTKTPKDLQARIDVEAGRFFLMKRTKSQEIRPSPFQGQVPANDIYDVVGGSDLIQSRLGKQTGHMTMLTWLASAWKKRLALERVLEK
jgi:hypothetical protein